MKGAGVAREGVPNTPFEVRLGEEELHCLETLRALPGKRLVCRAMWRGREVAAKLFLDPHRARVHWSREEAGMRMLSDHAIPTPELLHASAMEGGGFALLCAWEEGENGAVFWRRSNRNEQAIFLLDLVDLLAQHHQAGLIQEDLHLKNFLITGHGILTLDGGDVRRQSGGLERKESLWHLGLLLAQLPVEWEGMIPTLLARYGAGRGWEVKGSDTILLSMAVARRRAKREGDFLDKVFRECTAIARVAEKGRVALWVREKGSPLLDRILEDPDATLAGGKMLKAGRTCTVWAVAEGGMVLVVKRYNIKGWLHAFSRAWRESRGAVSWRNAHLLTFHGLATTPPVALIERRLGPLRGKAWFISEWVDGVDCRAYLTDEGVEIGERQVVAERIVALFRRLGELGLVHGDMKASNLLIRRGEPLLLDLDAMTRSRRGRDGRRFLANWEGHPFWKAWFMERGVG